MIWFTLATYLISLPKEEMYKKEGMTTHPALPIQSLAILFYQICQAEKYTCREKILINGSF
jgi:hypothetical protein